MLVVVYANPKSLWPVTDLLPVSFLLHLQEVTSFQIKGDLELGAIPLNWV